MMTKESNSFCELCDIAHKSIVWEDVITKHLDKKNTKQQDQEENNNNINETESDDIDDNELMKMKWVKKGFLKPFRSLVNLSGFKSLKVDQLGHKLLT